MITEIIIDFIYGIICKIFHKKPLKSICCNDEPIIRRVGDWKQFYAGFCSQCGKTLVPFDRASISPYGAIREWNKSIKKERKVHI